MLYRSFGKTGWDISAVGLGCWNIGNQWGELDDATVEDIIQTSLDGGVNLFDVAESYGIPNGLSELRLGQALKGKRDNVYIVSKIGHWGKRTGQEIPKTTADMIRACGHACCGRLRTEWIDVMLCHDGGIKDPSIYLEGFRQLREEGFIREYGISTTDLEVLKHFYDMSEGECAVVEVDYSLINRAPEAEFLPFCREKNLGVLVRGPVAMGLLAGKYDADSVFTDPVREKWNKGQPGREAFEQRLAQAEAVKSVVGREAMVETALRYVISHPVQPVVIPGATKALQAAANAAAGAAELSADRLEELRRALAAAD